MLVVTGPSSSRVSSLRTHAPRQLLAFLGIFGASLLLLGDAHAQAHTALDFDGVDDYVEMDGTIDFNAPFTVEAWILARSGVGGGRFISTRSTLARAGVNAWEMDVLDTGSGFDLRIALGGAGRGSAPFDAHMNTWTHVAGTWEGPAGSRQVTLYINGTQVDTGTQPTDLPSTNTSLLFGRSGQSSGYFDGRVDEVRIWSAELDQPTIEAWMHSHITPSHPNLAALEASWRLDEESGQTAASDVNSPTMDGRLGSTSGVDASDPTWVTSDVVPTRETSIGGVKSRYQPSR